MNTTKSSTQASGSYADGYAATYSAAKANPNSHVAFNAEDRDPLMNMTDQEFAMYLRIVQYLHDTSSDEATFKSVKKRHRSPSLFTKLAVVFVIMVVLTLISSAIFIALGKLSIGATLFESGIMLLVPTATFALISIFNLDSPD